jgi:hypothetical protein
LHKFCDECFIPRKNKSDADDATAALADVPASVRAQNCDKRLTMLKKKVAQMSDSKSKN